MRKTVTILFADVVASTELGERLDPEALRQVVTRYFDEMAGVLEAHGGTVEKFIGDEVMAVFGVPAVHEDDALRAVRAAAAMHERLRTLNAELEATWGARLAIRIGINTGEVVAGDPSAGHGFVTGSAVNVAKRLEQAAEPGEVLLGDATHRLVRHAVETTPIGPISLRGKREHEAPQRLEEVRTEAEALARRFDTPLVGRRGELARLELGYAQAVAERRAHLVTLLGTAGIGKSRLAKELLDRVSGEATALVGRCLPYGEGITFWPVRQILPDEPLVGTNEEIFLRIRRRLEELGREQPLVVCLDDVHWAEPTLLDLVQYLAGWIRDAPVLLLCLGRPELLELRPDWLVPGSETSEVLVLGALKGDAAADLLEALDVPPEVRAQIADAAEGNPLFVEQMAAMALERGADVVVPPSIRALLAARLDLLDAEESAIVEAAAVVGRDFSLRAVLHLLPPQLRPQSAKLLLALVRRELVRPNPAEEDGFRFRHALIRDAAYDALPKGLRGDLHERHAKWLEQKGRNPALVGYHLEQAVRLQRELGLDTGAVRDLAGRAGEILGAAGREALGRDDVRAAAGLLGRALALLAEGEPRRLEVVWALSNAYWSRGEVERAEELLDRLAGEARAAGDERHAWYAAVERVGRDAQVGASPFEALADAGAEAVTALERLGDTAGLARAWRTLAFVHQQACRFGAAEEASERALTFLRLPADSAEEARIVDRLCTSLLYGPTPVEGAIGRCRVMLADAEPATLKEANVATALAGLEAMRGSIDEARELIGRATQTYEALGLRLAVGGLSQVAGDVELLAGDAIAAEQVLRAGYEILAAVGATGLQAALLARVLYARGLFVEAAGLVATAEAQRGTPTIDVIALSQRAKLEAREGNEAAAALAEEAVELAGRTDSLNLRGDALLDLAESLRLLGREDEAADAADRAIDLYGRKGNIIASEKALALARQPLR